MNLIEVRNLTKKFQDRDVLKELHFSVKEGEVFGFLGPNGAGKTTTMRILLGLLRPTAGEGLVFGENLSERDDLRRKVGILLENNGLYNRLSAAENLEYFAHLHGIEDPEERIGHMLEWAGLLDRKDDPVGTFSMGMKRKLGLARAILHDPEILFLDEPSSGLDPEAQKMVRDLIQNHSSHRSITVFLNSHHLDEVERICSTVAILHRGAIQVFDTVHHLQQRSQCQELEMWLEAAGQRALAVEILSSLPEVKETGGEGGRITAYLIRNASAATVLQSLVMKGIRIEEMRKVTRTLEEIYLEAVRESGEAA